MKNVVQDLTSAGLDWDREKWRGSVASKFIRAADGQEVVDLFAEHPAGTYDIILMDIMMPKMDGPQAAKAIRAMYADRPDAEEIPIIALSANAFSEDVQASLDAGMNGHVSKPLNMEEVTKVIERNLNRP